MAKKIKVLTLNRLSEKHFDLAEREINFIPPKKNKKTLSFEKIVAKTMEQDILYDVVVPLECVSNGKYKVELYFKNP